MANFAKGKKYYALSPTPAHQTSHVPCAQVKGNRQETPCSRIRNARNNGHARMNRIVRYGVYGYISPLAHYITASGKFVNN
jgi:hypothetical protein